MSNYVFPCSKCRKPATHKSGFCKECRGPKYGNVRTEGAYDLTTKGYSFASGLERSLFTEYLRPLEMAKEITDLQVQPTVRLPIYSADGRIVAHHNCRPDYKAFEVKLGKEIYYEAKGAETERFVFTKKLWKASGPGPMRIFKGSAANFKQTEEIVPV